MELIRSFARLGKGDAGIAGGKGASLGEMTQAGIPVPPGFVVLAEAFERFLEEADLNQELDTIFHTVNHQEIRTVDLASEKIRALITGAQMPDDIAALIYQEFKKLDARFVAVRSSATAEDSSSAAWAGQLDTFLNTTETDLIANVQKCWASLFTPRAIFYRFEKGMHGSKISVAVVVQKMVQSEVSGIAFSVHPVTEDYNQLIIEAGFGLGEAIVSGQVTPDSFVVEKTPRRIIDKNVTFQSRALWRAENGGNEWRELAHEEGSKPALSDEQTIELAELVLKIEQQYGFPCDIEWAYEAGHFYITQSRPITTLAPKASHPYATTSFIKMGQWAVLPADMETWMTEHTSRYFFETFGFYKGSLSIYIASTGYMHNYMPLSFFARHAQYVRELTAQDHKALERILLEFYPMRDKTRAALASRKPADYSDLTIDELIDSYRRNRDVVHRIVIFDQFGIYGEDYWPPVMTDILVEKLGLRKDSAEFNEALFALTKPRELSTTLAEKRDVLEAALRVQKQEDTLESAAVSLAEQYGWMPVFAYGDPWTADHYREELGQLTAMTASQLETMLAPLRNYTKDRDDAVRDLTEKYSIEKKDLQVFIDFGLVTDTRNEAEYIVSFAGYHMLPIYREICRRLYLSPQEVRMLYEVDIEACLKGTADVRALLAQKQEIVAWGFDDSMANRINFTEAEAKEVFAYAESHSRLANQDADAESNKGLCASPGKARGVVRIVPTSGDNTKVGQGDIMFTYATTVDYLPAMKRAGGVVTEVGGLTCHAAVVSREFGIPCVVGLKDAMKSFRDGDIVEVDNGVVRKV